MLPLCSAADDAHNACTPHYILQQSRQAASRPRVATHLLAAPQSASHLQKMHVSGHGPSQEDGIKRLLLSASASFLSERFGGAGGCGQAALGILARSLHCSQQAFGFCGTKDKRAVTEQAVTAHMIHDARMAGLNRNLKWGPCPMGSRGQLRSVPHVFYCC